MKTQNETIESAIAKLSHESWDEEAAAIRAMQRENARLDMALDGARGCLQETEAKVAQLRAEIERNALNAIDTMNKMHAQHAAERDRLAKSEEGLLKTLGLERREKHAAQTERDRMKAALQQIASQKTFAELEAEAEDDDYDLIGAWDIVIGVARKALGGEG